MSVRRKRRAHHAGHRQPAVLGGDMDGGLRQHLLPVPDDVPADGSFVVAHRGSHDAGSVTAHCQVVEGLGTGGLATLRGEAELRIAGQSEDGYELVLRYDL